MSDRTRSTDQPRGGGGRGPLHPRRPAHLLLVVLAALSLLVTVLPAPASAQSVDIEDIRDAIEQLEDDTPTLDDLADLVEDVSADQIVEAYLSRAPYFESSSGGDGPTDPPDTIGNGDFQYVALGDSYASGENGGNYLDGGCDRSRNGYPVDLLGDLPPATLTFAACAGATTSDILNGGSGAQPTQIDSVTADSDLITLHAGGNDLGFRDVVSACIGPRNCQRAVDGARAAIPNVVGNIQATVREIADRANPDGSRTDKPEIRVLGYVRFWNAEGDCETSSYFRRYPRRLLSAGIADFNDGIRDGINALAPELADQVSLSYVEIDPLFDGHRVCSSDRYIRGVNLTTLHRSFHPNATGYSQIADLLGAG